MKKEDMVRKLVAYSVKTALAEPKHYWLSDVFEKGFTGYRNLSRVQLQQELQMRGLEESGDGDTEDRDEYSEDMDADFDIAPLEIDLDEYDPDKTLPLRSVRAE